jgi:hypothetical protein
VKFLSKIELVFTVQGSGCVIVPIGLTDPDLRVRVGDTVQLRSGTEKLDARIAGVELIEQSSGPCHVAFLLSSEIGKSQIHPEMEIWIGKSN